MHPKNNTIAKLSDGEIAFRLRLVGTVFTPTQHLHNDILEVGPKHVVVRSERSNVRRSIPFADLRRAGQVTRNGVVVRAIAQVLGLYNEDRSAVSTTTVHAPPKGATPEAALVEFYIAARRWVENYSDWMETIDWDADPRKMSPNAFLEAYAWAVYVSGFRARVVQGKWDGLKAAWRAFNPARIDNASVDAATAIINHEGKAAAVLKTAVMIVRLGWEAFRAQYCVDVASLSALPWMGPANSRFVARNLNLADVGKPDVWITRVAAHFGLSPDELFAVIKKATGDAPRLSDAYLWAYLSDNPLALGGTLVPAV